MFKARDKGQSIRHTKSPGLLDYIREETCVCLSPRLYLPKAGTKSHSLHHLPILATISMKKLLIELKYI